MSLTQLRLSEKAETEQKLKKTEVFQSFFP